MITVENVKKSFGKRVLWENLSFDVQQGEMLALTGPSGCGKSTLLNCLGLLEGVDAGRILVNGTDITKLGIGGKRRFRRDVLGYLFQNYALIDNATVAFNLSVAKATLRPGRRKPAFEEALQRVGLDGRADEMVYRLSGGEQQRVALARLIVKRPSVVLADEPTGALDQSNADMVTGVLRKMAASGCAVVIATHSQQVVDACDRELVVGADRK